MDSVGPGPLEPSAPGPIHHTLPSDEGSRDRVRRCARLLVPVEGSRVLLVEDDPTVRATLRRLFESERCEIQEANCLAMARSACASFRPEVVLLDYELPDGTALDLLPELKEAAPDVPVLILTGHRELDVAVATIKAGAEQFLTKPPDLGALLEMVRRLLEQRSTARREQAGASRRAREEPEPFAGRSAAIRRLAAEAALAAQSESPVLLLGETGTGKGVLARWLHASGRRARQAFVDINCGGLSRELLDSELFGHAKGAFTGALNAKPGLFEAADRGTFFLDEVGDIELALQPKILKVVEEKRFRRLGEVSERRVDVRLIAATHRDLGAAVADGSFRLDLYYRLNTLTLRLPPLRERRDDLPDLTAAILARLTHETGRRAEISPAAEAALAKHSWPGNIRELRNVLERALLTARKATLEPSHLGLEHAAAPTPPPGEGLAGLDCTLADLERRYVELVLRRERGQVDRAAERLDLPRSTLYQKLKLYGLSPSAFRGAEADGDDA